MVKPKNNAQPQPKFGFARISWQIQKYYFLTRGEEFRITSSSFDVEGFWLTTWQLTLRSCKYDTNGRCTAISIDLETVDYFRDLETVIVGWNMWCEFSGKRITLSDQERKINRNTVLTSEVKDFAAFKQILQHSSYDTLYIGGYLLIRTDDHASVYKRSKDIGLKSLSEDMDSLFVLQKLADRDLFVHVGGQYLSCHKAVLCARNIYISDNVDKNSEDSAQIDLEHNLYGIHKVFKYLYSGNLDHVLRTPSLAIVKAIEFLGVRELLMYYTGDSINLETKLLAKEFLFKWNIIDITTKEDMFFRSPDFSDESLEATFRLYLDMKHGSKSSYIGIRLKFVDGVQPHELDVKFEILTPDGDKIRSRAMRWSEGNDGIEDFFPKYFMLGDIVRDGVLSILFSIHRYDGIRANSVDVIFALPSYLVHDEHYKLLSNKLEILLETKDYSDFTIFCRNEQFEVHKCILLARSYFLRTLIKTKYQLTMNEFDPRILRFVLHNMYTGRLITKDIGDLIQVYFAAKNLSMQSLRNLACLKLGNRLKVWNVLKIFIFAIENNIYGLKEKATLYISNNIIEIRQQDKWEILRTKYSLEYKKVVAAVELQARQKL